MQSVMISASSKPLAAQRIGAHASKAGGLPAALPFTRPVQVPATRTARTVVRATETKSDVDVDKIVQDLQQKWDAVENKTSVVVYGAGALVFIWFSSTIVSAVNAVPLLPKFLELVGLGYSAWFVYRYLLFKSSREELISDVDELKKKITGGSQ